MYTRTGRPFFTDPEKTAEFLDRVRTAVGTARLWDELRTGWLVLDCELMPWSAKADQLIRGQYATVGAAARSALPAASAAHRAARPNPLPRPRRHRSRRRSVVAWWTELTTGGGEGMVVKPFAGLARRRGGRTKAGALGGLCQPGLKVRGPEYLRLIYGPDYAEPDNLARLRKRGTGRKRGLALREYARGLEALDRLVRGEPLWRIHQAVFGVLALESEPVDPRL